MGVHVTATAHPVCGAGGGGSGSGGEPRCGQVVVCTAPREMAASTEHPNGPAPEPGNGGVCVWAAGSDLPSPPGALHLWQQPRGTVQERPPTTERQAAGRQAVQQVGRWRDQKRYGMIDFQLDISSQLVIREGCQQPPLSIHSPWDFLPWIHSPSTD